MTCQHGDCDYRADWLGFDSDGRRLCPTHWAAHVRAALAKTDAKFWRTSSLSEEQAAKTSVAKYGVGGTHGR